MLIKNCVYTCGSQHVYISTCLHVDVHVYMSTCRSRHILSLLFMTSYIHTLYEKCILFLFYDWIIHICSSLGALILHFLILCSTDHISTYYRYFYTLQFSRKFTRSLLISLKNPLHPAPPYFSKKLKFG